MSAYRARLPRPEATKRCRGECGQWLPLSAFSRKTNARDGRQAVCRGCMSSRAGFSVGLGTRSRWDRERAAATWRTREPGEVLRERAELREGHGLLRCQLPRMPEIAELHLSGRDVPPCAALVFMHEAEAHLRDLHRVEDVTADLIVKCMRPVADAADEEDAA